MATTVLTITHGPESNADLAAYFGTAINSRPKMLCANVENLFAGLACGAKKGSVDVQLDGGDSVAASGTVAFSAVASANDTFLVNGVTFTAKASGATGNEFNIGASATASAANLSAAINASATALVSGTVSASAATGTVTITALVKGQLGNAVTIAKGVDAGSVMTVSGARLTGGSNATARTFSFGQ